MRNFLKAFAVIAAGALFTVGGTGSAQAGDYSCSDTTYGAGNVGALTSYAVCGANNTYNSSGLTASSTAIVKAAAAQSAGLVSNRVANAVGGATMSGFKVSANGFSADTGMSAGNKKGMKFGAWVDGSWSDLEDSNTATAFDGDVFSVMGGIDYSLTSKTIVGLAVGYEDLDIDTAYNGTATNKGNLSGEGYTVAPYIGTKLSDYATASLTLGMSWIDYDTLRFDPNNGNRIAGSTNSIRYFGDASVNGEYNYTKNWRVRGKASMFFITERKEDYAEKETTAAGAFVNEIINGDDHTDYASASAEAKIGYMFDRAEPYALVGVNYDVVKDEANVAITQTKSGLDRDDFSAKFGGGVDFNLGNNITAGIEGYTIEFIDDYDEYGVSGGLRMQF